MTKTKKVQQSALEHLQRRGGGESYIDATRGIAMGMGTLLWLMEMIDIFHSMFKSGKKYSYSHVCVADLYFVYLIFWQMIMPYLCC